MLLHSCSCLMRKQTASVRSAKPSSSSSSSPLWHLQQSYGFSPWGCWEDGALLESAEMKLPAGNSSTASSFCFLSVLISFFAFRFLLHITWKLFICQIMSSAAVQCVIWLRRQSNIRNDREISLHVMNRCVISIYADTTYWIWLFINYCKYQLQH